MIHLKKSLEPIIFWTHKFLAYTTIVILMGIWYLIETPQYILYKLKKLSNL